MTLRFVLPACLALALGLAPAIARAGDRDTITVTSDTAGYLLGRWNLQVEVLPTRNDGIALMPFVLSSHQSGTHAFLEGDPDYVEDVHTHAEGLDLQYRRYIPTMSRGGRGFFVALGFELQHFSVDHQSVCVPISYEYNSLMPCPPQSPANEQRWTYIGPSVDVGGQWIFRFGLVLSASAGLHARAVLGSLDEREMPWGWSIADGPGLRARTRLMVGWALD
jgi:hypothetical protein